MAAPQEPNSILSFEEARHLVERHAAQVPPQGKSKIDVLDPAGWLRPEPVAADRDFPPFNRAARDGYAVRAADLETIPAVLDVVGEIKAGAPMATIPALQSGQ